MAEKWYEGLPDDAFLTETDKLYKEAEDKIREALDRGLDFESACATMEVADEGLRAAIIDDMLKVLIAEEHFTKEVPLAEMASRLKIPVERLEAAKLVMLEDVKQASIKAFYQSLKPGNA